MVVVTATAEGGGGVSELKRNVHGSYRQHKYRLERIGPGCRRETRRKIKSWLLLSLRQSALLNVTYWFTPILSLLGEAVSCSVVVIVLGNSGTAPLGTAC